MVRGVCAGIEIYEKFRFPGTSRAKDLGRSTVAPSGNHHSREEPLRKLSVAPTCFVITIFAANGGIFPRDQFRTTGFFGANQKGKEPTCGLRCLGSFKGAKVRLLSVLSKTSFYAVGTICQLVFYKLPIAKLAAVGKFENRAGSRWGSSGS